MSDVPYDAVGAGEGAARAASRAGSTPAVSAESRAGATPVAPKPYRDDRPLRWRIWWRFGMKPLMRLLRLLPIAEWRREQWSWHIDVWAMKHIGRQP